MENHSYNKAASGSKEEQLTLWPLNHEEETKLLSTESRAVHWIEWFRSHHIETQFRSDGTLTLPVPPNEASYPHQSSGPLWFDEQHRHLNILVATDIWCRVAQSYYRKLTERQGRWISLEKETSKEAIFCSALEFSMALLALWGTPTNTVRSASQLLQVAKAKASTVHSEEENNLVRWVRANIDAYSRSSSFFNPAKESLACRCLLSKELYDACVSDRQSPHTGRALEMALVDAMELVFRKELSSGEIAKKKKVLAGNRGWLGVYWTPWSHHHPHNRQDQEF